MKRLSTELVVLAADAVCGGAVGKLLSLRAAFAREILLDKVRANDISLDDAVEQDEALAMMHKYLIVALEGAASDNLHLMAEMLAGRLREHPVRTTDYLHWAETIKSLTEAEMVFLVELWKAFDHPAPASIQNKDTHKEARDRAHAALVGEGKLCRDFDSFEMIGARLSGTGLVVLCTLMGPYNSFRPTARLATLVRDAKLERLVRERTGNDQ